MKSYDWRQVCGGSIGGGIPLATGAAIGAPDRPAFCFEGDGSAMYTLQALWTQAREEMKFSCRNWTMYRQTLVKRR